MDAVHQTEQTLVIVLIQLIIIVIAARLRGLTKRKRVYGDTLPRLLGEAVVHQN